MVKHDRSVIQGAKFALVFTVLGYFAQFSISILIPRVISLSAYGVLNEALSYILLISTFVTVGLDRTILKVTSSRFDKNEFSKVLLFHSFLIITVIFAILAAITLIFHAESSLYQEKLDLIIRISPLILMGAYYNVNLQYVRGQKRALLYAFLNQGRHIFLLLVVLVSFLIPSSYIKNSTTYLYFSGTLIFLITFFSSVKWEDFNRRILRIRPKLPARLFKYSVTFLFSSSMLLFIGWINTIVAGLYFDQEKVGIYNALVKYAALINLPLVVANAMGTTRIAELFRNKKFDELKMSIKTTSKITMIGSILMLVALVIFQGTYFKMVSKQLAPYAVFSYILFIGNFINTVCGSIGPFFNMTGNNTTFEKIVFLTIILDVILLVVLIPLLGFLGLFLVTTFSMSLWNIIGYVIIYKKYKINTIYLFK